MQLTPEDIAYLRAQAAQRGYTPQNSDDMLRAINYESRGDASRWGGKGGDYMGLIQFGPNERRDFNIDTVHPNARNQIDGMFGFFKQRGYKPGMPMLDLYSTINAGSPGHYKASDGNGTVESHVAKMMGMKLPEGASQQPGMSLSGPSDMAALSYTDIPAQASTPKADPIGELLAMQPTAKKEDPIGGLLSSMQQQPQRQKSSMDDDFVRQMMDFHSAQHQRAIQGLL